MPFPRYPSAIKAGSVNDAMVLNVDFCADVSEFAGLSTPAEVQGRSLKPLLAGSTPMDWPELVLSLLPLSQRTWHRAALRRCTERC